MRNLIVFHIDVNSAYLSWTAIEKLKEDPSLDLRTIPSIIGGDEKSRHGIVLAKSVPAGKLGIQTAEPVASAFRKCPTLHMEPPDRQLYKRRSRELMALLRTYTPDIEQVSIDECYLDFTPIAHRFPSARAAAEEIAARIRTELGFTVNIGIAPNKLLAKMASDFEKPDRVHTLFLEEIPAKMWPLPVRALFMVGRSSAERLADLGIRTIGDLAHADPEFLRLHFKSHGIAMWEHANGIDRSFVDSQEHELKGIGNSTTLASDITQASDAKNVLLGLAEQVAARLRKAHQIAGTVTVEIKYSTFQSFSRQTQALTPVGTTDALYRYACRLFDELWNGMPIRLLGIRTTRLLPDDTPVQLSLFDFDFSAMRPGSETEADTDSFGISKELPGTQTGRHGDRKNTEQTSPSHAPEKTGADNGRELRQPAEPAAAPHILPVSEPAAMPHALSVSEPAVSSHTLPVSESGAEYNTLQAAAQSMTQNSPQTAAQRVTQKMPGKVQNAAQAAAQIQTTAQNRAQTGTWNPLQKASQSGIKNGSDGDAMSMNYQNRQKRLDEAVDQIRRKFGAGAVTRGALLNPEKNGSRSRKNPEPDQKNH